MTSQKNWFTSFSQYKGSITIASGKEISVLGIGDISLDLLCSTNKRVSARFKNVLYVPELKGGNLISESKLELEGYEIVSKNGQRRLFKEDQEWMFAALDQFGQYIIKLAVNKSSFASYMDAHKCLGHPGQTAM